MIDFIATVLVEQFGRAVMILFFALIEQIVLSLGELLVGAFVTEVLGVQQFELAIDIASDTPGSDVQEDLFICAQFVDEVEHGLDQCQKIVIGKGGFQLFEKGLRWYFEQEYSAVYFFD